MIEQVCEGALLMMLDWRDVGERKKGDTDGFLGRPQRGVPSYPIPCRGYCTNIGSREKRRKAEFNGKTNIGLPENGSEIGFSKSLIEGYMVESLNQETTINYLHLGLPLEMTSDLTQVIKIPYIEFPSSIIPATEVFAKYSESWMRGALL